MSKDVSKKLDSLNSDDLKKIPNKITLCTFSTDLVIKQAENEVFALILSAILGSIIERWEIPSENRLNDLCSFCKSNGNMRCPSCKHNYANKDEALNKPTSITAFSELSYQFMTQQNPPNESVDLQDNTVLGRSINDTSYEYRKSQITSMLKESFKNEDLPSSASAGPVKQQITFMSLFEDEKENIFGWNLLLEEHSEIIIQFKQGNRYEGSLMRCQMDGHGKFFWTEGSTYEGAFSNGEMTGEGCLEWADQSWYEGELVRGYRHGRGLYVQSPRFYCGEWSCGRRHGDGTMFYGRGDTRRDYYDGQWSGDRKHGAGTRSYPGGAVYSGQWDSGRRHGLGTMVWLDNDVYSGNWEGGFIHGYGEYTWATFFNSNLAVPQENCFYGDWKRGIRNGNGTLETSLGAVVRGTWKNGLKHGPAQVICSNGLSLYATELFVDDCLSSAPHPQTGRDSYMDKTSHLNFQQLFHVPVNAANHEIDLTFYIGRLNNYWTTMKRKGREKESKNPDLQFENNVHTFSYRNESKKNDKANKFVSSEVTVDSDSEEALLRNVILQYLSDLKMVYNKYSRMCCATKPKFTLVLMRIMMWQLFRDCDIHKRGYSLENLDTLIANNKATLVQGVYYPFERIQFWQFLHCLIELSWEFYGKNCVGKSSVHGILASGVYKLITEDILPNVGRHKGKVLLEYKNLLSLDSMYWFYRGLGEPLPARKLLTSIFATSENIQKQNQIVHYPEHLIHGKNNIGNGGKLSYRSKDKPFMSETRNSPNNLHHQKNLTYLSNIGLLAISECLLEVCPSISSNSLIVNMDYNLVFLEFFEILLSCATIQAKKNIQERKWVQEKTAESNESILKDKPAQTDKYSITVENSTETLKGQKKGRQSLLKVNKKKKI